MGDRIERALLEAVSLCINSDVCDRCLLSNEAAIRQDACSAVLQVVRHAMSCPTTSSTQRLVDVLFSFLLRSLPTTVFRRRHCGVYYSLLADIMQLSRAHHPSLLSNGPLQQGLTAEGLADLLCSLLLLCPAYECRAGIDSAAHVEDELLQGVAVTLTALVSGKSADLCERVGCDNAVICFLLSVCLDTVSLPSPAEHVLDRMTASEGTVQSALWRRCVAAIGRCLQADPDDVVKVSLSQQTAAMPKARREPTRRACVLLLRALCAGSQRCAEVAAECAAAARSLKCFQEHAGCAPSADVLDACSLRIRGMSTDATGICNPASVCYVTSISQLLYSIPEFRAVVLSMDMSSVALSSVSVESKSIVVELQLLFARLLYSHCHTVSVEALVAVMMDETGVPFTVFEQRDAVRVMTKILTAVEQVGSCVYASQLPNPKVGRVHFLKHIIGGLFAHEFSAAGALSLVCEDHVKFSRMESFFMLGARVSSDVDSLCATLEATCSAADKIPGFDWTEHLRPHLTTAVNTNLKFDTEKRTLISLLPRNLLVHIQRYDFDFDHCVQVKLNHRLEFPDSLQLPSNCLESTCRSRTYSLSGILLHSGEALSGHYKSFVKSGESTKFLQSVLSDDAPDDLGALRSAVVEVGSVMSLHDAPPSVPVPTATLKSLTSLLTARADGRMDPQTHAALPPDPPSEAEVGLGLALDKLIQLVDRGGNLCTENNLYWMECNDERISIVATTAIVDAAFGWKQDDTCSTEIKKKKKRKVKPNTATAVGEASIEQRSSAMLLVYKSAETDTDVFCPFINVDNILNLFISVRNENIGYWEQQRGNDWSSYSFMLWLAHCSPFGSASVVQSCLQQVYLLDLLMETNPITLDEQSAQMLPGTIHWLLKTATLDCSESERRVPKLFQCRLSTCLSSALVSAVKTSLSIHPFATAIAPPIGDQSYVITRMISMNEVMDEGDTLNVFVEPYGFAKALIRCCIHLSPLLPYQWTTITDVLEVYVNCSDYTRHWLISNGVVAALLLAFDNTDTVAQLSCRSCAPEERRLLGLLSALCAESNVCSSAYSQAQDAWSDEEADVANGASDQRLVMHNCQISSPGVLRRLLLAMDSQRMRMAISNVMTFMLKGSKERTIAVVAVLTEILISLGQDIGECSSRQVSVKSAMRACIVLCGIIDDLCDWRIERSMTALVGAVRSSQVRTVRDVYAEMLPRLCRLCPGAAIWVSHNEGWADFIDDLSIELKLNKDMLGNMSDKKGICMSSLHGQTDYVDSDDEPQLLIGHRVTVAWSGGHVYSGTVTAYHSDTNLHDVHYDDNERKSYVLSNTYSLRSVKWSLEKVSLSR